MWNWGCSDCRGVDFEDQDHKRLARNCDGSKPNPSLARAWAPTLRQCIWSVIEPEAWAAIEIWHEWREFKVLPYSGDMFDQPASIYEGIKICESLRAKSEADRATENQKQIQGAKTKLENLKTSKLKGNL